MRQIERLASSSLCTCRGPSRMHAAMSIPSPPPKPSERRVLRSFLVSPDLWKAFAERAEALECSADWLLSEAMKRLIESGPRPEATMRVQPSRPPSLPLPAKPIVVPPPPQRPRKTTGTRRAAIALVATSADPAHADEVVRSIVDADRFVIGRSPKQTNMVLRDPAVSRQHAIVERTAEGYVLVDIASRNGVLLNGARVTRAVLRPGDVIAIGPFSVVVERS
jgi:hypothetical protein